MTEGENSLLMVFILKDHDTMDASIYEVVEKILYGVSFIAIGGVAALIFFFIFAPSILGSKTIHKQIENLQRQVEQMNEQLKRIARILEKGKGNSEKKD